MAYRVSINTKGYTRQKCSEKNWEPGTVNNFIYALDGWKCREPNLRYLMWRLEFIAGRSFANVEDCLEEYKVWIYQKKNRITFCDEICGFHRTEDVSVYGIAQGYVDLGKKIEELRKKGSVTIEFTEFYDTRQRMYKTMKGCYILVEKV